MVMSIAELEAALCQKLAATPELLRRVFEIEQMADDNFVVKLRREWIDRDTWLSVNDYVREKRGICDSKSKQWMVPYGADSEATDKESGNRKHATAEQSKPLPVKCGYYQRFPVDSVVSPSFSLRMHIGDDIDELIDQITATRAGAELCVIAEPLVCRPAKSPGCVEVGGGERRLLAARKLGLGTVPVVVKEFSDEEFDRIRLMENLARKDMTDYEVARAIKYLMSKYPDTYSTQASIAEIFGKTQGWVAQRLRMLELAEDKIITRVINPEQFTERQARALLEAPEERRPQVARHIAEHVKREGAPPSAREIRSFVHPQDDSSAAAEEPVDSSSEALPQSREESEEPEERLTIEEAKAPSHEEPKDEEPKRDRESTQEPKPESIDTGIVFTCPECGWQGTHIHHSQMNSFECQDLGTSRIGINFQNLFFSFR